MRFADAPPTAGPLSGRHIKLPPPRARAAAARPRPTHLARSRAAPVAHLAHLAHLACLARPRLLLAPVRRDAPGAPLAPEADAGALPAAPTAGDGGAETSGQVGARILLLAPPCPRGPARVAGPYVFTGPI